MEKDIGLLRAEPEPAETTQGGRLGLKSVCVWGGFPTRHGRSPQTLVGNVIEAIEIAALGARRD